MKTALFVLVAALAACGGRTSLDQRSAADAVSADARADNYNASYSYDGQFEDDSGDVARAVRSHALAAILADLRGPQARRNFGCWYSQMDLSVRWNCEDAGGLSAARSQSAMLTINLERGVD